MIQWTKEAEEAVGSLPLPPMLGSYARLECERLARKKGLNRKKGNSPFFYRRVLSRLRY